METHKAMVLLRNRIKSIIKPEVIGWGIVFLGFIVRIRQYFANRSFWGDEASLAINIVSRSFIELTRPLGFHQAAPVGFLFIEKFLITVFGNHDYILRLFPLFSGILALYLIYRITLERFDFIGVFALLMFALNTWLVNFSVEFKQYGSDVMVTLLLIYLSIRCLKEKPNATDFLWLGVVGFVAIWVSHVSVFILPGIGLALAFEKFIHKKKIPFVWLLSLGAAWLISFGIDYLFILRQTAADKYFYTYWLKSFLPLQAGDIFPWLENVYYKFVLIILDRTDLSAGYMVLIFAVIGGLSLWYRQRSLALIIISPFIVTLIASALQKYPLSYRFMLFLLPFALLLMAEGIGKMYQIFAKINRYVALALCSIPVLLMFVPLTQTAMGNFKIPPTIAEMKPVLAFVEENKQPGDIIYVHYRSVPAFNYYAPFFRLDTENVIIGKDRQNPQKALDLFFSDIKELQGKDRVWVILSEIPYCYDCEGDKQLFFENSLNENGSMRDRILAPNAVAYLYDFNP